MNRVNQIGFSQRVRLEWLEETARLVLAGNNQDAIESLLQKMLHDKVSIDGTAERGTREKIITILLKVWVTTPPSLKMFKLDGLDMLKNLPHEKHLAVHWGMVMAVYPFWPNVASQVGRLLKLQGSAAAAHVQRRVREQYGERETVSRAARRVLTSFRDWGVLNDGMSKGVYVPGLHTAIDDAALLCWLIEASLYARCNCSAELKDLLESPALFPFRIKQAQVEGILANSPRMDVVRHGLDEQMVMLRPDKGRTCQR